MKKTRVLSFILAMALLLTAAPLTLTVFADVDISTPGENAYLDVNFKKGSANTDIVNKCLRVTDRENFWVGAKVTTTYRVDPTKSYEVKVDVKAVEPNGRIRPLAKDNKTSVAIEALGTGGGVKFNSGEPVANADGWYTHTYPYVPTAAHTFSLHLCGGSESESIGAVATTEDFYIDNFVLLEDGVPVVTYDFNSDIQFADWAYTNGYDPKVKGTVVPYARTERPADPANTPDSYMAITNRENFWAGAIFDPNLNVTAGETYIVKFDIKGDNPTTGIRAYPENTNPKNQKLTYNGYSPAIGYIAVSFDSGTPVAGREGWYTHEIKYEALTNHNFVLQLPGWPKTPPTGTNDCDFYVDNLYLYKEGVAEPIIYYSFTPGTDYSAFYAWTKNDGKAYCESSIITPPAPIIPEEDCGAGVAINTGITAEVGKTYTLEFALSTNLEGATYFANVYTGTNTELVQQAVAISGGTAYADADGWYKHTLTFTATNDGLVNFEILGGEDFAFINNLVDAGTSIYIDSLALYEDGVSGALWSANYSTYSEIADAAVYNETGDKINVKLILDPTKFVKEEVNAGASGILAMLLLRRKAMQNQGEEPVAPEAPAFDNDSYMAITNRASFWAGAILDPDLEVKTWETYIVKFDVKGENPGAGLRAYPENANPKNQKLTYNGYSPDTGYIAVRFDSGTPVAGREGWYTHEIKYEALTDHNFVLRLPGWPDRPAEGQDNCDFYIDNVYLYKEGESEPILYYSFTPGTDYSAFRAWTENDGKAYCVGNVITPSSSSESEEVESGPSGYLTVTERPTFWSGVQLETFTDVYEGKTYTIKLEMKLADPTDDFRLGTVEPKVTTDTNIGAGNGVVLTSGTPVKGKDGWYSFSFPYVPTQDHTFALRIFGGWIAKGTELPNVAKSDMYIDNFRLYENGVEEPIIEYKFETIEFFEDWSPLVLYTPDVADPIVDIVLPE